MLTADQMRTLPEFFLDIPDPRRKLRILTIMNTHSYHREHLLYSRIGLGVFLR